MLFALYMAMPVLRVGCFSCAAEGKTPAQHRAFSRGTSTPVFALRMCAISSGETTHHHLVPHVHHAGVIGHGQVVDAAGDGHYGALQDAEICAAQQTPLALQVA